MPRRLRNLRLDRVDLVDAPANPGARVLIVKRAAVEKTDPGIGAVHVDRPLGKEAQTKTEGGVAFPATAYAYVPDPSAPSTWKLRLWESPQSQETAAQVGRAVAALGKGFRGQKVSIPAGDLAKVKAKVRAAWKRTHAGADASELPAVLKSAKEKSMAKLRKSAARVRTAKKLKALAKDAADMADRLVPKAPAPDDGADGEPQESDEDLDDAYGQMQAHCEALADAISKFGDPSKLPADHPIHALKAMHKALSDRVAEYEAAKNLTPAPYGLDDEAADLDDDATPDVMPAAIQKSVTVAVAKATAVLKKELDAANARATEAEKVAKAERDARAIERTRVSIAKFASVGVKPDTDAAIFKSLEDTNPDAHKRVMDVLESAAAEIRANSLLRKELGSPLTGSRGHTAWAEIEAEADKIVAKGEKGMTKHKAIDVVMKQRTDLVRRHYDEENAARA